MTVSAVTNWELQRNEIIQAALRKCGVLAQGQTPSTEDYTNGTQALNALIQVLSTEGMQLWKRTTVDITPVDGTSTYTVSNVWQIAQVLLVDSGGTVIELEKQSKYDINRLSSSEGQPVAFCYTPALENGSLQVWPIPDASTAANKTIRVVYQKELFTFNASTDTPDFPAYWTEALIYGLAHRLAPEYGVPLQDRQLLNQDFMRAKEAAEGYGDEGGSMYFSPDWRY